MTNQSRERFLKLFGIYPQRCNVCGKNKQLIINRFEVGIFGRIIPVEYLCNYHYRIFHNIKTDDFKTELDDPEFRELVKLMRGGL